MADCHQCNEPLRDFKWALVALPTTIVQICEECLIKNKEKELAATNAAKVSE